ncbi:MAG: hypothetical protein K8S94_11045 [Planctomycetia bacterium]|nr:hypothetical protein [Planctomycetia bacterium]
MLSSDAAGNGATATISARWAETPVTSKTRFKTQEKSVMLPRNVPTSITLSGHGYRHHDELDDLVKVSDPRVSFEGKVVDTK